jgi:FtsH-binding integral membrane protein
MAQYNPNQYYEQADAREYAGSRSDSRVIFIRKTYAHLLGAVLCWVALVTAILNIEPLRDMVLRLWFASPLIIFGLYFVGSIGAQAMARSKSSEGVQYLGLALYTVIEAIVFTPLLLYVLMMPNGAGAGVIQQAGILTLIIFGGLTTIVMMTKKDFSFLRNILWLGSLVAFGLIVVALLGGGITLGTWFCVGMIVLMSGFILYDTSNVLHHFGEDQHVAAALELFASLATLFWYVLRLAAILNDN